MLLVRMMHDSRSDPNLLFERRMIMKTKVFCLLSMVMVLACSPLRALGEISESQAIELANKEVEKYYINPAQWHIRAEKDRREWQATREAWEHWVATVARGGVAVYNARIAKIENAIKGREVWFVTYKRIIPPGQVPHHSEAIVFLDAQTGQILDVKNQEE
jgi:hypothetical protein